MRLAMMLALMLAMVFAMAELARADLDKAGEKVLKNVSAHLTRGQEQLDKEAKQTKNASKLRTLDRALYFYGRADKLSRARKEAEFAEPLKKARAKQVETLNRQALIHFARKSLARSEAKVKAVLKIDPKNALAKATQRLIDEERKGDIYDGQGDAAIDRIRARRRAAGLPLRDRGRARRTSGSGNAGGTNRPGRR